MSSPPPVRRADKLMADDEVRALLARGYCARLATVGADGYPYCVPLLYVVVDDEIWLHNTAARGHLRANVEREARVCLEVDEPGEIFPFGRFECDTSIAFASVVIFGRIRIVEDEAEKIEFYTAVMRKYAPAESWGRERGSFPRLGMTVVYAITPELITGKQGPLPPLAQRWSKPKPKLP